MTSDNMELSVFHIGSPLHLITVAACFGLAVVTTLLANRSKPNPATSHRWRTGIAISCLVAWIINTAFWLLPSHFQWDRSLPLHLCNLANLLGAYAIWKQWRPAQSIIYYWACGLCVCAFITPSLHSGIDSLSFWVFWIYHGVIPVAIGYVLIIDQFRPNWSDFARSSLVTTGFVMVLAGINWLTGWNYGFVGKGKPLQTSLLDWLGPYPIRILYIVLLGTAIFALLTVPWQKWSRSKIEK